MAYCKGSGVRAARPARVFVGMFLCRFCGKPCKRIPGTSRIMDHYPDDFPDNLRGV